MRCAALIAALLLGWATATPAHPPVASIEFSGNRVTQPRVMLREIRLQEGDPADPEAIEAARQAIQNLGLFRSVDAALHPLESGVAVIFTVEEKIYLLPVPRLDAKDNGEYAYGAQVSWTNLLGLNQDLRVYWEQRDAKEQGVGREDNLDLSYFAPLVFDSRWSISTGLGYTRRPVERADSSESYSETFRNMRFQMLRNLSDGPPSQGWTVSAGLAWTDQDTSGALAPPPDGSVLPVLMGVGYRQIKFHRYSETGIRAGLGVEVSDETLGSDYDEISYTASAAWLRHVGDRDHQNLNLFLDLGVRHGGTGVADRFELGGTGALRGYESDFLEGDAYYLVTADYLRPVWRDWLRVLARAEAGNVFEDAGDASLDRIYASLALGFRIRIDWFVNLDFDIGYAFPIGDAGEGGRVFAGRP